MLTNLSIKGFRCFRELEVPLKPLTVLIGPNDTGKSSFLEALKLLGPFNPKVISEIDFFRSSTKFDITAETGSSQQIELSAERSNNSQFPFKQTKALQPHQIQQFQLPNAGVATRCAGFGTNERSFLDLKTDGSRVAALLDHILRSDLSRYLQFRDALKELVPGLEDIAIETPDPQSREIYLILDRGFRIPADRASAGVRLLLFFLALTFHPTPPDIVLLEEPETGMHPRRLAEVMELLRKLTQGELGGHPAQVILTTHSPYLLDLVDLETDQVLVFQREADGNRTATPANAERIREFFDGFLLGEVWFNEQEIGLLGEAV
ncbi:MAG: AAA family ATPase [Planctomycetota bacterium]|nr:AAA family ATPase [Planctomycetota bacterium]MDA1162141.1 AAA family ATPase [Planctomycetota bacterium]